MDWEVCIRDRGGVRTGANGMCKGGSWRLQARPMCRLVYTSDAADDRTRVDAGADGLRKNKQLDITSTRMHHSLIYCL